VKSPLLLRLAESLGPPLIRLLGASLHVRELPRDPPRRRVEGPVIYAFWHGRMLVPAFSHRGRGIAIMVSQHRDGEYIARVVERLGFVAVRGSTTRGGVRALREMLTRRHEGRDLAFTPDGPRGPRYVVQKGVIYTASRTGLPIVPAAVEAKPAWVLGSWDEFTIPKPFGRAVILTGEPMAVPPDADAEEIERHRGRLEAEMHRLMGRAREILGIETPGAAAR
jgi:lysophospholipid acyltransferase (LPLAT)-like uncharacterized protein